MRIMVDITDAEEFDPVEVCTIVADAIDRHTALSVADIASLDES